MEEYKKDNDSKPIEKNIAQEKVPNSVAVLVLGIVSIVFSCICWGIIGFVSGIVAIALSSTGKKQYLANPSAFTVGSYKNLTAGRTCAIIGTILSSVIFGVLILIFLVQGAAFSSALPFTQF